MRFAYMQLAEAVTTPTPDKINALGFGVRQFLAQSFPTLINAVVVAQAEASPEEIGSYPFRVTVTDPNGKRIPVVEVQFDMDPNAEIDRRRPLMLQLAVPMNFIPIESRGAYRIKATIGRARAEYVFVVDSVELEGKA